MISVDPHYWEHYQQKTLKGKSLEIKGPDIMMMIIISLICIWSSTLAFTNRFQSCYHPQSRQCQHVKMMVMMRMKIVTMFW